jgi:hypothetical protein
MTEKGAGRPTLPHAAEAMARQLRRDLAGEARAAVNQAIEAAPPQCDRRIDRLRISLGPGADTAAVGEAIRRAMAAELARRR